MGDHSPHCILALTAADIDVSQTPSSASGLPDSIRFNDIYFDNTCLKADIHFPTDWVLLRAAARTLMKATVLIRKHGLKIRMLQDPLEFLSEMNTLCMKMAAKGRATNGKKQRKKVLRETKVLEKRIGDHAMAHLAALKIRRDETTLSEAQAQQIITRTHRRPWAATKQVRETRAQTERKPSAVDPNLVKIHRSGPPPRQQVKFC